MQNGAICPVKRPVLWGNQHHIVGQSIEHYSTAYAALL